MRLSLVSKVIRPPKHLRQVYLFLLLVLLLFGAEQWIESLISARNTQNAKVDTLQSLSVVRAKLETILNHNLSVITGMSIAISANPNLSELQFSQYARNILRKEALLLNLAAAPDMIVKFVYPLEGNEKVIGLNYLKNLDQKEGAVKVKLSQTQQVVGPVDLVQGGRAFIGRAPVYYFDLQSQTEKFWGILSAPMIIDKVLSAAGFFDLQRENTHSLALRKKPTATNEAVMLYGSADLFDSDVVLTELIVADERWELAAEVNENYGNVAEVVMYVRFAFSFFILLLSFIVMNKIKQSSERSKLISKLAYRESMLARVGSIANVGGWEYDLVQGFKFWSDEVYNILGLENKGQFLSLEDLGQFIDSSELEKVKESFLKLLSTRNHLDFELAIRSQTINEKWVQIQAHIVLDVDHSEKVQGVIQDITERKRSAEIIRQQANYDPLTQLINRNQFDEKLNSIILSAREHSQGFALLYIDLDRFKLINDSLGHTVGDKLLVAVAQRFLSCIRDCDILSRRSGDEFTLIITNTHHSHAIELVAKNLLSTLKQAFSIAGNQIYISASIGISRYPQDGRTVTRLLKTADQGMYQAKNIGRNTFCYFTKQMQIEADRRLKLQVDLIFALDNNLLDVYFQPIVDVKSGTVAECEALIRWNHCELGAIPAQEFVSLAEDVGLISKLGNFVMHNAIDAIKSINSELGIDIGLAINKSYREFFSASTREPDWMLNILNDKDLPRLTVEITESLLIDNDEIYSLLNTLRSAGVKIAIDDFGTGYSSLSYLRKFPVDILKIDRSFVTDIDVDIEDLALVDIILDMANNLAVKVVAEGVENQAQLTLLKDRECDFCQGYYIARPMAKIDLKAWLAKELELSKSVEYFD